MVEIFIVPREYHLPSANVALRIVILKNQTGSNMSWNFTPVELI